MSAHGCGHCKRAGHYRPTCPDFDAKRHELVSRRVREALERTGATPREPDAGGAREAITDARAWGMW